MWSWSCGSHIGYRVGPAGAMLDVGLVPWELFNVVLVPGEPC